MNDSYQGDEPENLSAFEAWQADEFEPDCPLHESDDKFQEAHYFLERMMFEYHNPEPFRWNLNAFLQALRSVTFFMQNELAHHSGFVDWYAKQQDGMRNDSLLRKFVDGRNIVVKQRNLIVDSTAEIGVFRYRETKAGILIPMPAHVPSVYALTEVAPSLHLVHPDHPFIGEEYGVLREWYAHELGEGNVVALCDLAWVKIGAVIASAHMFLGIHAVTPPEHGHDPIRCNLLTESDLDPSLPEKWGWT